MPSLPLRVLILVMPSGLGCVTSRSTHLSASVHLPSHGESGLVCSSFKATFPILGCQVCFHFRSS